MNKFLENEIKKIFRSNDRIIEIKHKKENNIDILFYQLDNYLIELFYKENNLLNGFKTNKNGIGEYIKIG